MIATSSSDERDSEGLQRSPKKRFSRTRALSNTNSMGETADGSTTYGSVVETSTADCSSAADDNEFTEWVKGQSSITRNNLLQYTHDLGNLSQLRSIQLNLKNATDNVHKDSGFSSCSSSQELMSDLSPVMCFASTMSQETYCSEFEEIEASKIHGSSHTIDELKSFDSNVSSMITSQKSNMSQASTISTSSTTTLSTLTATRGVPSTSSGIRSTSSCLGPNLYRTVENIPARINKRRAFSDNDEPEIKSPPLIPKPKSKSDNNGECIMCCSAPKDGVFVHSTALHLCCCYKCAVKIFNEQKRCPICKCKVNNVQKIYFH